MTSSFLKKDLKKMVILYGTQTGTSERFAQALFNSSKARNFQTSLFKMDDYDYKKKLVLEPNVLFLTSTFYNGEFPDNARKFWSFLNSQGLDQQYLKNLNYSVFGLGNSSFKETFTRSAKLLDSRLLELGAKQIIEPGFGDEYDANGHESGFRVWTKKLWTTIGANTVTELPSYYKFESAKKVSVKELSINLSEPFLPNEFQKLKIVKNELLTAKGYEKQVNLLTFEAKGITFKPGDQVQIQPYNTDEMVERMAKVLKIKNLDEVVELKKIDPDFSSNLPQFSTPRKLLKSYIDIQSIPSRSFLEELSLIATDKKESSELESLATNFVADNEYKTICATERFSIVDCLEKYKSAHLKLEQLISLCPTIFPRYYSICSSPLVNSNEFQITVAIDHKDVKNGIFEGLASAYLARLKPNEISHVKYIPGFIDITNVEKPLIGVGLGTGLGVLRGILQHHNELKKQGKKIGKMILFSGVRHKKKDFIFENEFKEYQKNGIVEIIPAFSMDQEKFITVADKMDEFPAKVYETLNNGGSYIYCGLGGSIPEHIEQGVAHAVSKASGLSLVESVKFIHTLKYQKKWHVEAFSISLDDENSFKNSILLKGGKAEASKIPIYDQYFQSSKMFCFQCEQTSQGKGCSTIGVCGKTPEVAGLQDLLVDYAKQLGWYAHNLGKMGVSDAEINRLTLAALFSTLTNVNFDASRMVEYINDIRKCIKKAKELYLQQISVKGLKPDSHMPKEDVVLEQVVTDFNSSDEAHMNYLNTRSKEVGLLNRFFAVGNDSVVGLQEMLVYGLKGVCAYADHALLNGKESQEVYSFIHEALAFLSSRDSEDLNKCVDMLMKCGQINFLTMQLLHSANTTYGAQTPHQVVTIPSVGKCILISGHDLKMLEELLKQSENQGVDIYTHGEMLPAHGYEGLRKYKNLKGHFGGAWQKQSIEFPQFPGAIVMTTNCLTAPKPEYSDRLYTVGAVGFTGIPHISEKNMDFSQAIKKAKECTGFTQEFITNFKSTLPKLTVGFGHETIIGAAGTIVKAVQAGLISRFYFIGGCDGFEGERNYFTEFAKILPKTSVVMTGGCGKYRINHLEFGTIGDSGIPRLLDLGQCNDSYSAIQVALALKEAFGANSVNDLPLSIIVSWFEQKAVAVLLTLLSLGIRNVHIGPHLPAFLTPQVFSVLQQKFNLTPAGDPKVDLQRILNPPVTA